jgi:Phosphodiester glycosidase
MRVRTLLIALFLVSPSVARSAPESNAFRLLEPGLELGELAMPVQSAVGDSRLLVLRIDPEHFELRLLNASATEQKEARSAREWSAEAGLAAAINASMYQTDLLTSVSLMQSADHVNNGRLTRDRAVLAFDRADSAVPHVELIDLTCQDFDALRPRYRSLVQSIRMISCQGENTWKPQEQRASNAAVAVDTTGRVLFLHCRSPYTTHDLIAGLLALPLGIAKAMYAEGGAEAQLYVRSGDVEIERTGLVAGGLLDGGQLGTAVTGDSASGGGQAAAGPTAWPIPNVIGIVRRTGTTR